MQAHLMRWHSKKGRNYLVSTLLQFLASPIDWTSPAVRDRRGINVPTSA